MMNRNVHTSNTLYIIFYLTSYQTDKHTALSLGLDHHIPTKSKDVAIEVEFEQFYQGH